MNNPNQFFEFKYGDEPWFFETNVNAEGNYNRSNGTILGTLYQQNGKRMATVRVLYTSLVPIPYSQIKKAKLKNNLVD